MISQAYLQQLTKLHTSRTWGASGYSHAPVVAKWRRKIDATTVLDYGCGRATLKDALCKLDQMIWPEWVYEYDPAIPGKDGEPMPADLLVANDVLEHIEPEFLSETLDKLRGLAKMGAFFTIALTSSKVWLPDGRNAHLIIQPANWWRVKLAKAGFDIQDAKEVKGLWVWSK